MAISPMMQQYLQIKEENPGTILFFRLGDFYEMFFEDAKLASQELELTLTGRDCGLSERAPMCGVPFHAVDVYVARLIEKGYKVAICEQMTDPAESKGLVERAVTRVITPGTIIESNMLDETSPNYLLSVCLQKNHAGVVYCDVSTGEFRYFTVLNARLSLADEVSRLFPHEVLLNTEEARELMDLSGVSVTVMEDGFTYRQGMALLRAQFGKETDLSFVEEEKLAVSAAGALLRYLADTQKKALGHILEIKPHQLEKYMKLDRVALRNLEITQSLHGSGRKGTLLSVLDKTKTAMGSRLLRGWLERPLYIKEEIEQRLSAVEDFVRLPLDSNALREALTEVYDVERLLSKIAYDAVNAKDCLALLASLDMVPLLKDHLASFEAEEALAIREALDPLTDLTSVLRRAISPDAPFSVREGGIILTGYSEELDELRDISENGKGYLAELEQRERDRTGIKNLKVGYNRVFGYYIEVTRSFYELVPMHYVRKQTLANCERFITDELKDLEHKILGANESAVRLEYRLFLEIREMLKNALARLNTTADAIKRLDALLSLAQAAQENDYVRPIINDAGRYEIIEGRHPVVEEAIGKAKFVPNDTTLDGENRVMIITGPNMAGKSTYMRQVALTVLMAHVGSFVPAQSADIALTDRIFTRIGASDDLYAGQSTFMVEMAEMATILKFATKKSLLILDEVGRGTSTFDGLSIAWAAVEFIAKESCGARTLFATHYHELSELEGRLPGIVNYRITAKEQGEDVIFLRKIVPGGADRSYGVAVAKLAGLPNSVIARARQIMARLEVDSQERGSIGQSILEKKGEKNRQVGMLEVGPIQLVEEISKLDVISMTPIDALNKLFELNEKAKRI